MAQQPRSIPNAIEPITNHIQMDIGPDRKNLRIPRPVSAMTVLPTSTFCFAHSLQRGPAGPMMTHLVQIGLSQRPHRSRVNSFL